MEEIKSHVELESLIALGEIVTVAKLSRRKRKDDVLKVSDVKLALKTLGYSRPTKSMNVEVFDIAQLLAEPLPPRDRVREFRKEPLAALDTDKTEGNMVHHPTVPRPAGVTDTASVATESLPTASLRREFALQIEFIKNCLLFPEDFPQDIYDSAGEGTRFSYISSFLVPEVIDMLSTTDHDLTRRCIKLLDRLVVNRSVDLKFQAPHIISAMVSLLAVNVCQFESGKIISDILENYGPVVDLLEARVAETLVRVLDENFDSLEPQTILVIGETLAAMGSTMILIVFGKNIARLGALYSRLSEHAGGDTLVGRRIEELLNTVARTILDDRKNVHGVLEDHEFDSSRELLASHGRT